MAKKFLDENGLSKLWAKIKSMFVKKSGATDVNKMSFKSGQYQGDGNYAIDLNNSDVRGANMMIFGDPLNSCEGLAFPRDNGNYDLLRLYNGELLLNANLSALEDEIVASNTPYKVITSAGGTFTGNITLLTGACISGETTDTKVFHSIELGYPNKDYLDFNEYGGVFNFNKTNNQTKEKIAYIDGIGVYHNNKKLATEEYVNNKMPTFSYSNGVLTITTH